MEQRLKVLLVDDDIATVELTCRLLRAHGFESTGTTSAIGATSLVALMRPDIVLLDVNLPQLPGDRLLTLLRRDAPPETRFVLYSAEDEATLRRLAREVCADAWLSKSVPFSEIDVRLRRLCRAKAVSA
jgi:two-component system, OmpR family, response regulator